MKRNSLKVGLVFVVTSLILVSCASESGTKGTDPSEKTPIVTEEIKHPLGIPDKLYQTYLDKSFVSTGNNYRVKKFLEKLRAGEDVYIAALGGSVTEGAGPANFKDGYAYQFVNMLKGTDPSENKGKNIHFDCAGLSGTPSSLGLIRYQSDVVDVLGCNPDLLIIEFSVNDDGSSLNLRAFEQLIRQAYEANAETAVIAVYSAATYGNQAGNMKPIADYYGVPQVNLLNLVTAAVNGGLFTKSDYYSDYVHPTFGGHQLQAEAIMNLIAKIDAEELTTPKPVPEKSYSLNAFDNFARINGDNEDIKIEVGSFKGTDPSTQSIKKTNKPNFPQNWHHVKGSESFVMDINCKALVLTYKVQGSWLTQKFGKADVYVDGKKIATYDGGTAGGWCNCEPRLIIDEPTAKNHKIEIKMAQGDEDKGFTIVAMGYNK